MLKKGTIQDQAVVLFNHAPLFKGGTSPKGGREFFSLSMLRAVPY